MPLIIHKFPLNFFHSILSSASKFWIHSFARTHSIFFFYHSILKNVSVCVVYYNKFIFLGMNIKENGSINFGFFLDNLTYFYVSQTVAWRIESVNKYTLFLLLFPTFLLLLLLWFNICHNPWDKRNHLISLRIFAHFISKNNSNWGVAASCFFLVIFRSFYKSKWYGLIQFFWRGTHNFHYSMKFIFSLEAKTIMLRLLPWSTIHKHNCMHGTCTRSLTRSALAQIINIYSTMTIRRSASSEPLRFTTHTHARIKKNWTAHADQVIFSFIIQV